MHSNFLKKFIKETLYFIGCWLFLSEWNNGNVVTSIAPPKLFRLSHRGLSPRNVRKNSATTKFWRIFKQKPWIYFFQFWYHSRMVFICLKQWKHELLKYVKYAWKSMCKVCWKPKIKAQEQGDGCSFGISIINFRDVSIQNLVEHLQWTFFTIQ